MHANATNSLGRWSAVSHHAAWIALAGILVAFSIPTYSTLARRWVDFTYSHGYLVVALSVMLAAYGVRRKGLRSPQPSYLGSLVLVVSAAGVVLAHAASIVQAAQLLLPIVWIAAVWGAAGWSNARVMLPAAGLLYFAIPWWDVLTEPLQSMTVLVVGLGIRLADIPAYIEGNFIHVPSGTFEVAGGCSGLHYVIVGSTLAALIGLMLHERWPARIALSVVALGLSLVANWVRVFTVVVAGHVTDMQHYLVAQDHYYFGWALFAVCLVPLFYCDRRLQRCTGRNERDARPRAPTPNCVTRRAFATWGTLATGAVLAAGIGAELQVAGRVATQVSGGQVELPSVPGWLREAHWEGASRPTFVNPSFETTGRYRRTDSEVAVYLADYAMQRQEHEVVYFANRPEGSAAQLTRAALHHVRLSSGERVPFNEVEAADRYGGKRLLWWQFRVGGVVTASEHHAKVRQAIGALIGRSDAQALVLTADCITDCDTARAALTDYVADAVDRVYECVDSLPGRGRGTRESCDE